MRGRIPSSWPGLLLRPFLLPRKSAGKASVEPMCGPSGQEQAIAGQQQNLSTILASHFGERFGQQSAVLQNLNNLLTPISLAGPDQQGFGPQELAALNTQASEGVGANYAKASVALNNVLAARGGGQEFLPTGAAASLKGTLASAAADTLSREQSAITTANYGQGRQNWQQATAGLSALANQYDPTAFSGQSQSGYNSAFGMAHTINQEQSQKEAAIAGGIAALGLGAATFGAGGIANLGAGESFGEGIKDFFTGGTNALNEGKG
jgi:hypothetical protein